MNKKIVSVAVFLLVLAMLATPVLAFGPIKPATEEKNKNALSTSEFRVTIWTKPTGDPFPMKLGEGVFKSWRTSEDGTKTTYTRLDAAQVNIGNAEDGSAWTFPVNDPDATFELLVNAETKWVYLSMEGYYNMLLGNGYPPMVSGWISAWFPEGVYFKATVVGK